MKTLLKLAFIAVAVLVGVHANAQDKPITFGVEAGLNMSNFSGDLKGDLKPGFNIGVTLDYALSPNLYLMPGLKYSLEGAKEDDAKMNFSYLKLPVHVGYKLPVGETTKVVFHAGPYISYAVDGSYKIGGFSVDAFNSEIENELGYKHNRFDFGLGLGVGVEVGKIYFDLGWDYGLTDIIKITNKGILMEEFGVEKIDGKNMNAYLTVGYKF